VQNGDAVPVLFTKRFLGACVFDNSPRKAADTGDRRETVSSDAVFNLEGRPCSSRYLILKARYIASGGIFLNQQIVCKRSHLGQNAP
jgi:hypothetical protein